MQNTSHLLRTRRFLPIFITQFLGAFNDNLFRTAMVLLVIYGIYRDAAQELPSAPCRGPVHPALLISRRWPGSSPIPPTSAHVPSCAAKS